MMRKVIASLAIIAMSFFAVADFYNMEQGSGSSASSGAPSGTSRVLYVDLPTSITIWRALPDDAWKALTVGFVDRRSGFSKRHRTMTLSKAKIESLGTGSPVSLTLNDLSYNIWMAYDPVKGLLITDDHFGSQSQFGGISVIIAHY